MNINVLILGLALGCLSILGVDAQPARAVPTNSLAFHLQSLGRTPTQEERQIVTSALALMWRQGCRSDYPLRSIKHDDTAKEWVLLFDSGVADGAFRLYVRDERATWFEVNFAGTTWRTRFPAKSGRK
jgi:hypothetical protein